MAIFYFQSGKTFADVDQRRVTVGMPIGLTGSQPNYTIANQPLTIPQFSGLEVEMTGRYIHHGILPWERPCATGN